MMQYGFVLCLQWASENITQKRVCKRREGKVISAHFTCKCIAIILGTTLMSPHAFPTFNPFLLTFAVRKQLAATKARCHIYLRNQFAKCHNDVADFNLLQRTSPFMLGCCSSLGDVLLAFFSSNSRLYRLNGMSLHIGYVVWVFICTRWE